MTTAGPSTEADSITSGIERPLPQEAEAAQFLRALLEHVDEGAADDLAFLLGIGDAFETRQERSVASTKSSGSCSFSWKRF
jgi:hypothetical protein